MPNSGTKSRLKSFLIPIHSHLYSFLWDFDFFKLTQPLTVSPAQLLYTVKEKGGKPDRKPYPLPYGLRNPYRNLKSGMVMILHTSMFMILLTNMLMILHTSMLARDPVHLYAHDPAYSHAHTHACHYAQDSTC